MPGQWIPVRLRGTPEAGASPDRATVILPGGGGGRVRVVCLRNPFTCLVSKTSLFGTWGRVRYTGEADAPQEGAQPTPDQEVEWRSWCWPKEGGRSGGDLDINGQERHGCIAHDIILSLLGKGEGVGLELKGSEVVRQKSVVTGPCKVRPASLRTGETTEGGQELGGIRGVAVVSRARPTSLTESSSTL